MFFDVALENHQKRRPHISGGWRELVTETTSQRIDQGGTHVLQISPNQMLFLRLYSSRETFPIFLSSQKVRGFPGLRKA
jgi:hypothetical protein